MTERRVVYEIPGMTSVNVEQMEYRRDADAPLMMNLYRAADRGGDQLDAAVIFVLGYSDVGAAAMLGCRLSEMEAYVSWAQLLAACGMTAITYWTGRDPEGDLRVLLEYVGDHCGRLGIDRDRVGVIAFSGNAPNAMSLLTSRASIPIRSAAVLWGFMLDIDGSTGIAEAEAKWRFVNPTRGVSIDAVASDIPLCIGRSGRDENPGLNQAIDAFVAAALKRNLPVTVINHPTGVHAFDVLEDSVASRAVIRQVLEFLRVTLLIPSSDPIVSASR